LLILLRPAAYEDRDDEKRLMTPPSGADTLEVRQTYLRTRRSGPIASRRRAALWIVLGAAAGGLCIAGVGGLVLGS
jgi:hypothetical protein